MDRLPRKFKMKHASTVANAAENYFISMSTIFYPN